MSKDRNKKRGKRAKPKRASAVKMSSSAAVTGATTARKRVKERIAAMANVTQAVCEKDNKYQALRKVLRNSNEPIRARLAALQAPQTASFAVVPFQSR